MKTNRRSKRVKKTRRNRRSRRTQRGGGKFGDSIRLYASKLRECNIKCDRDNPDPLTKYTVENPTPSGWYITYRAPFQGYGPTYEIKNKSIGIEIITNHNPLYQTYLDMLEELPDPTRIYITSGLINKKEWKLTYDSKEGLLQWENQADKSNKQPFIIESPLKIGDKNATL